MEEQVQITALKKRQWSIMAISRHLGRDPKTIRSYLKKIDAGIDPTIRAKAKDYQFEIDYFRTYIDSRFDDDAHLCATTLYFELRELHYSLSYSSFTRQLRISGLRPKCPICSGVKSRYTTEIIHPPGEEIQFDYLELPVSPLGQVTHVLVGTLAYSSRSRAVICESEDRGNLILAIEQILERFGGTARKWRFDNLPALKGSFGNQIAKEATSFLTQGVTFRTWLFARLALHCPTLFPTGTVCLCWSTEEIRRGRKR